MNLNSNGEIAAEEMAECNLIQLPGQSATNLEVLSGWLEPCPVRFWKFSKTEVLQFSGQLVTELNHSQNLYFVWAEYTSQSRHNWSYFLLRSSDICRRYAPREIIKLTFSVLLLRAHLYKLKSRTSAFLVGFIISSKRLPTWAPRAALTASLQQ